MEANHDNGKGEGSPGCGSATANASAGPGPVASAAPSSNDLGCPDFGSQAEAEVALEADPSDPNGPNAEGDGQACEVSSFGGGSNASSTATAWRASKLESRPNVAVYAETGGVAAAV